jgi:hypothetical protein
MIGKGAQSVCHQIHGLNVFGKTTADEVNMVGKGTQSV